MHQKLPEAIAPLVEQTFIFVLFLFHPSLSLPTFHEKIIKEGNFYIFSADIFVLSYNILSGSLLLFDFVVNL